MTRRIPRLRTTTSLSLIQGRMIKIGVRASLTQRFFYFIPGIVARPAGKIILGNYHGGLSEVARRKI